MFVYTLELIWAASRGVFDRSADPLDATVLEGRAWLHHCDHFLHINNAQYLKLMDYGRTHYFSSNQMLGELVTGDFSAVVAGSSITYRRSINAFRPYGLSTRVCYHDDHWVFFEQIFRDKQGREAVRALVRVRITRRGKRASFAEMAAYCGTQIPSMAIPLEVQYFDDYTDTAISRMQA